MGAGPARHPARAEGDVIRVSHPPKASGMAPTAPSPGMRERRTAARCVPSSKGRGSVGGSQWEKEGASRCGGRPHYRRRHRRDRDRPKNCQLCASFTIPALHPSQQRSSRLWRRASGERKMYGDMEPTQNELESRTFEPGGKGNGQCSALAFQARAGPVNDQSVIGRSTDITLLCCCPAAL
jgi:hypothetical protein